jgi:hypothetical protein
MQTFLRFTPAEYDAIAHACRPLQPHGYPPHKLQQFLVAALRSSHPTLAERLARFKREQRRILHQHLWGPPRRARPERLTAQEVETLADVFGPLLFHARFARSLKRAVVFDLLAGAPDLAEKVQRLSLEQFEDLCEQVKGRRQGEP